MFQVLGSSPPHGGGEVVRAKPETERGSCHRPEVAPVNNITSAHAETAALPAFAK